MSCAMNMNNWTEVNNENVRQLWECPDCGKEIYTNPGLVQFNKEQIPPICDNYEHHTNTEVMFYVRTEINNREIDKLVYKLTNR